MRYEKGALSDARCFNHGGREAAARCPECGRFFCRECVTEHGGMVLCATCLGAKGGRTGAVKRRFPIVLGALELLMGFLILWASFFYIGKWFLSMPNSFHEGTVWEDIAEGKW